MTRTDRAHKSYAEDYVVFDLETTGLRPNQDAIIEISALRVRKGEIVAEFSTLVNPQRPIPPGASRVNGITDAMVADAPHIETALADFLDFIGEDVLVGHNINSFDMKFIQYGAQDLFGRTVFNQTIDTLPMVRRLLPGLGHYKLTDVSQYFQIETEGAHRALNDCIMNQCCYEKLRSLAGSSDTENLTQSAGVGKRIKGAGAGREIRSADVGNQAKKQVFKQSMTTPPSGTTESESERLWRELTGETNLSGASRSKINASAVSRSRTNPSAASHSEKNPYQVNSGEDGGLAGEECLTCPVCGSALKKRNGRYGEFYGCTGFPACRYTQNV